MKLKNTAFTGGDQTHSELCQTDITAIRKHVISGDWTAINNRTCTLTDLGLRHNGSGLVWLGSGVSVHEADVDTGFGGKTKVSFDYHAALCPEDSNDGAGLSRGVHAHKVDSYCLHILTSSPSWVEYWHRNDGKALTTFAVQVLTNERQKAFDGWIIYRHPESADTYTVVHEERDKYLIHEYVKRGWKCESAHELSLLVKSNIEFSRLMARLGYIPIRTRQITGRKETFWVYRSAEKGLAAAQKQPKLDANYVASVKRVSRSLQALCPAEPAAQKAFHVFVQTSDKPRKAFKPLVVDGKWLYVYDDHVRFLTKKRHRIDGVRVQGYTAKGLRVELVV